MTDTEAPVRATLATWVIPDPVSLDTLGEYITVPELVFMTGQKRGTVERWRIRYDDFPEPDFYIGYTPVWSLARPLSWIDGVNEVRQTQNGAKLITYDVDAWRAHRDAGGFRRQAELSAERRETRQAAG